MTVTPQGMKKTFDLLSTVEYGGCSAKLPGAFRIFEKGSIPGACFRNREFTGNAVHFTRKVDYSMKMLEESPRRIYFE